MAERATIFPEDNDLDLTEFAPKKPAAQADALPPPELIRTVSEGARFRSREPNPVSKTPKKQPRRRRTGRNEQLNLKVTAKSRELFYQITDSQGWGLGETFEKAIQSLQAELASKSHE